MFNATRASLLALVVTLMLAFSPALIGQETAPDNTTRNQLIFGGAVIIIMIVYVKRRNKRKRGG